MDFLIKFAPILISFISLIISLVSLYYKLPRIKIRIVNKNTDCFYGPTKIVKESKIERLSQYLAGVSVRLYNRSSNPITIAEIDLKYMNDFFSAAKRENEYWETIEFFFIDNNEITTDGSAFDYKGLGADFPLILDAHSIKDVMIVFPSFPKMSKRCVKAKLYIDSSVGKKKKTVSLKLYDRSYSDAELEEVNKWWNSL